MTTGIQTAKKAPLHRQLFAMFYDSCLVVAVLFLATAILLPFSDRDTINNPFFHAYLLILMFNFYAWFWQKSGQTLGMQVWKLKIIDTSGNLPNWSQAYLRLSFSFLFFLFAVFTYWLFEISVISILCFFIGHSLHLFLGYSVQDKLSHTLMIDLRVAKIAAKIAKN